MTPRNLSAIITAAFVALVIALLCAFGYDPPDPPIPEEGVEVNVGDSDYGLGSNPEPASSASNYAPPAASQQISTQHTEPAPSVPSSPNPGNVTNPNAVEQPRTEDKTPEINQRAIFPGNRNRNQGGGSSGNTSGQGNMGKPNGTPDSDNYSGEGGVGNYSLTGRTAAKLPKPVYRSNKQGKVVVRVWVDNQGRVTRAEWAKGSTTKDGYLVGQALQAARQAQFNADVNAPEEQMGTITYIFKI